jgi:signal transduction histidine kinase
VFWAIQKGLRPLKRLAGEVAEVDSSKLDHRFIAKSAPLEMQPIIIRLNELLERLDTSFQRERRFTSDVSHELRTPVATLKTIAEVGMQEAAGSPDPENHLQYFQDSYTIASQMGQLIDSLLNLARCEAGLQKIAFHPVALGKLLANSWQTFETEAAAKNIDCQLEFLDHATVHSDQALLGAIFRNLFANSVAYTENSGVLRGALQSNGDHFSFCLENNCRELSAADLDRMFEPFWRKDEARSDAGQCGLGLALVKVYARLLNIELSAQLPEPNLLRITLGIPIASAKASA